MSPALAGRFLTTAPPGKPPYPLLYGTIKAGMLGARGVGSVWRLERIWRSSSGEAESGGSQIMTYLLSCAREYGLYLDADHQPQHFK